MTDEKLFCPTCGLAMAPGPAEQGCPHCLLRLALTADEETDFIERKAKEPPPLPSGLHTRFFGDYEVLEEIARGGMGVIYKARQLSLNRLVALKMIQASHLFSSEARLRFRMEVEAVAQLNHPHIVPLYESGEQDGTHFFTMRFVEGGSLAKRIAQASEQEETSTAAATLVSTIARAVHYAHQRGVLHRDLKPSNILLDAQGEPHVADFGLAKMLADESGFTFTESILGSPNYMAPEQASGRTAEVTVAADVYGLGAILYELLTGQPPFKAPTPIETIRKVCDEEAMPPCRINRAVDGDLETICLKCLRKEPAARYASAGELAADLERWLEGRPILARPVGWVEQAWRWCRRQPALASALAASVLLLIALAIGTAVSGVRIHRAEQEATANLRESLLGQARVLRLGGEMGQRTEGLRLLHEAARLDGPQEFRDRLRDEVLANLALTDLQFAPQPQLRGSSFDSTLNVFDPQFTRHAGVVGDTTIVIRRVEDGRELNRFDTGPARVTRLEQFSHDGRYLGVRHSEGISIWDVENGQQLFATNGPARLFAFAPRKPILALEEWGCELSLRQLPGGEMIQLIASDAEDSSARKRGWSALTFSPDGRSVAAARAQNNVIELFETATGRRTRVHSNSEPVAHLSWNPRQSFLAASGPASRIHFWNPYADSYRGSRTPPFPPRSLTYNPTGSLLAAACDDRMLRLWQSIGTQPIFSSPCDGYRIAFSPDGRRIGPVIRGTNVGWLELTRSGEFADELVSGGVPIPRVQFGPQGRFLAAGWRNTVGFFDPVHLRPLGSLPTRQRTTAFCFDPKGEFLLDSDPTGIALRSLSWTNSVTLECSTRVVVIPGTGWNALAHSADGRWFAAANSLDDSIIVVDRTLTNRAATLGPHIGVDTLVISPDARWVASGSSRQRRVKVWNVRGASQELELPAGRSARAAFSADGRWLASFGDQFELREAGTWRSAPALPLGADQPLLGAAAFSPDGRLLAIVRDQFSVQLFDLSTFRALGILTPPEEDPIEVLEFSPNGSRLAAGCMTGRIRSWDLRSTRESLAAFNLDWNLPPLAADSGHVVQRVRAVR